MPAYRRPAQPATATDGVALDGAISVTVSPDGKSAYVASYDSGAVAIFDRNTTTGALTQKPGLDACVSETGTAGACTDGVALDGATSVTVSPDGKSAYVASFFSDAVAVFDRNTTTGALNQKPGLDACVSETGTGGNCTDGVGLDFAVSVAISPDGKSAYVASFTSDAVAVFDRALPSADITPGSLTFGSPTPVPQGTVSPSQAVTITSSGLAPLKVKGFDFGGTDPDDFLIGSHTCLDLIESGQSCLAKVRFAPQAEGARSATLTVLTNAQSDPAVSLSGMGGQLPVGPTGPTGATGDTGPAGPQGPIGVAGFSKVEVSGPAKVRKGKKVTYQVRISNSGNAAATGVRLKVSGRGLRGKASVGAIQGGNARTVKVKLKFKKPGKVKATFKVTSSNAGGKTVTKKITVNK